MSKVYGVILASGIGERLGYQIPKQFVKVAGKTLVEHTIEVFERNDQVDDIILVVHPLYYHFMEEILLKNKYTKVVRLLKGGESRFESSYIGICSIEEDDAFVLIHDAVRPLLTQRIIDDCIKALHTYDAVDVAVPAVDTIIQVTKEQTIESIPPRKSMMRGQTPQAFKVELIKRAHLLAHTEEGEVPVTDDCGLILRYNLADVFVVAGEEQNIKITYPEDIFLADKIFQTKSFEVPNGTPLTRLDNKVVVVFGASRGIGESIVHLAQESGARVYGFSRSNGVDIVQAEQVHSALCDVYKKEGQIDYIINTAGILGMGKIETRDIQEIQREVEVNYMGSLYVVKESIPYLRESKGSLVLFTSSSYTRGRSLYTVYSSTKAAIVNLVQGLAEELLHDEIRVNAVNPERTATPMRFENFGREMEDTLLRPEKVAAATLKVLLSNLTGQVFNIRLDSE
ncbi:2-C-methyl-D-erythritol 4-phosphate cytidylyltransferase [Aneurinibacillus migulanus]|uniref:2-C-methyl-D-erythritol 4-phosphate cytidylyltransferase n=1 Tax=Aneurinibacillus migulanus TaxID=47500 RepID=A0A0D1XJL1_ANEMI|nr:2-C-methyl-D-erythritol 4-phosphate cytidylyltransferase [Aneurinibacillus migulanus]KIV52448.1 hypothetical protein TS65_23895 [Aneurinibacillus migulanus]KON94624.1 hypothetical protein AF333_03070 [Aneurinibacillus migulanus]MED0892674.1 2-C-methyl-D-erythritol 4-phosphate cytidylyltransferase [Aneurinibacillus migulanus]MED1614315.1 2-C-methyl-D-erythritol 4-phosphate cytidylyltransferase [Aneurinibacillus migulanus]SDI48357.1 2-C-methyl-D-erythritol 4-phosphate cytidylyltransferase [An